MKPGFLDITSAKYTGDEPVARYYARGAEIGKNHNYETVQEAKTGIRSNIYLL
jgi:hypothetical protein